MTNSNCQPVREAATRWALDSTFKGQVNAEWPTAARVISGMAWHGMAWPTGYVRGRACFGERVCMCSKNKHMHTTTLKMHLLLPLHSSRLRSFAKPWSHLIPTRVHVHPSHHIAGSAEQSSSKPSIKQASKAYLLIFARRPRSDDPILEPCASQAGQAAVGHLRAYRRRFQYTWETRSAGL